MLLVQLFSVKTIIIERRACSIHAESSGRSGRLGRGGGMGWNSCILERRRALEGSHVGRDARLFRLFGQFLCPLCCSNAGGGVGACPTLTRLHLHALLAMYLVDSASVSDCSIPSCCSFGSQAELLRSGCEDRTQDRADGISQRGGDKVRVSMLRRLSILSQLTKPLQSL